MAIFLNDLFAETTDFFYQEMIAYFLVSCANGKRSVMVDLDVKNPYALPPVRFLQSKQHGIEVSRSDAYLIETLITDFKMKPEVVNVLIEYVLEKTNQRFSKSYVEKIASVWVRLNIDTSEKALAHIK